MPDLRNQLRTIDLSTAIHHPPIVESAHWRTEDDTRAFAAVLARALTTTEIQLGFDRAFIELHGDLGAGKTTFVRHLLRALGVPGRIKSPTYAVVEPYELPGGPDADRPRLAWHFDFYRFTDPREWEDAGFRDIFAGPGLKLAEWPEHAASVLPPADLAIHIATRADESRQVVLQAGTAPGQALLAACRGAGGPE